MTRTNPSPGTGQQHAIVRRRQVGGLTLLESVHASNSRMPRHAHACASFYFVLQGSFTEAYPTGTCDYPHLSVITFPETASHAICYHAAGSRVFTVETSADWLERVRECAPILRRHERIRGDLPVSLMQRLHQEFHRDDTPSSLAIEGLALEMCVVLARRDGTTTQKGPARWLQQARDLLHARYMEHLSLSEVADLVRVHPTHMARAFRQQYGCTLGTYIRRLRIQDACEQLSAYRSSLVEIALALGFADQSHFARTFKRMMGVSPSAYRENLRRR